MQELDPSDTAFLSDLYSTVQSLVKEFQLPAYRLIVNGGEYQDFPQLHFHLISPSPLAPLPSGEGDSFTPRSVIAAETELQWSALANILGADVAGDCEEAPIGGAASLNSRHCEARRPQDGEHEHDDCQPSSHVRSPNPAV